MKGYYKLTIVKKTEIAQNLIDIFEKDIIPSNDTREFIVNWILTGRSEKLKAYYDVWDIVLRNFIPKKRPILIRSIDRKSKIEYIGSFTNSVNAAERFSNGKGYWIICDTQRILGIFEKAYKKGEFKHSFYPLSEVLEKAKSNGGWGFSDRFLNEYAGEGEHIMKIDYNVMILLKYIDHTY